MKYFVLSMVLLLSGRLVSAQDWARERVEKSPLRHESVTVKHDKRSVETFVVYPESKAKAPVVFVIHGISGRTDWTEDMANQIAEEGYIAVAPDLLSGMGPNEGRTSAFSSRDKAAEATAKLDPDQITADLNAVANYGLNLSQSSGKLFVLGFGWGGGQSFRFATNRPDLAAALVFYGLPPEKDEIARIKAPVYAFYAQKDAQIDASVPDVTASMKAADKTFETVFYEDADHDFMEVGEAPGADEPNAIARHEAAERMFIILKKITQTGQF